MGNLNEDSIKANKFIQKLARGNGWLSAEQLERWSAEDLESHNGLRELAAKSTETLSDQLYSKETRFVYELIQNAEDNNYSLAEEEKQDPWLSFTVSKERIIIDSNENGFAEANVRAICRVGESTKSTTSGYIGEKGIGFKSVFKAATKVHVQSGAYSFAFHYNRHDPAAGLGMVTPMVEPPLEMPANVRTRMILSLTDRYGAGVFNEFERLPNTLLLFLKKLKQLYFRFEREGEAPVTSAYKLTTSQNRAKIEKSIGGDVVQRLDFWIARRSVKDMPGDDKRQGQDRDGKVTWKIDSAEVVLAFPLDRNDVPVIEDQHVFAFLPLSKVGFKFLIQSDFITQASRETVQDCAWNRRLLDEAVQLFINNIQQFLVHKTLQYNWPRYLSADNVPDEFWKRLHEKLFASIRTLSLFRSSANILHMAENLRHVTEQFRYRSNDLFEPILPDHGLFASTNFYLSDQFPADVLPVLRKLGLLDLTAAGFLDRLAHDIERAEGQSRLKSTPTDSKWHAALAQVLLKLEDHRPRIKAMNLIPLQDGKWTSPLVGAIYFPTYRSIKIPTDLALRLVSHKSLECQPRKQLFQDLGVSECRLVVIYDLIVDASMKSTQKLDTAIVHVKFLYQNHHLLPKEKTGLYVKSKDQTLITNRFPCVYNSVETETYSPASVIGYPVPKQLADEITFLHPEYHHAMSALEPVGGKSGVDWLNGFLRLSLVVRLKKVGEVGPLLSPEIKYVLKEKPNLLIGVLKRGWHGLPGTAFESWIKEFDQTLPQIPVLPRGESRLLWTSYLPLPKLKAITSDLGLDDFPFIKELDGLEDEDARKEYSFLEKLSRGGFEEDLRFWIIALEMAKKKDKIDIKAMSTIYMQIQSRTTDYTLNSVRSIFGRPLLQSPKYSNQRHVLRDLSMGMPNHPTDYVLVRGLWNIWVSLDKCVWKGPSWYTLDRRISSVSEYENLEHFFVKMLGIPMEPSILDYCRYLEALKAPTMSWSRHSTVRNIYDTLYSYTTADGLRLTETTQIQERFKAQRLVYNSTTDSWHSPLDCIWADEKIQLPNKFSVKTQYPNQEAFFLKVLCVETPKLEMHINALIEKASKSPPDQESMKQTMINISQFLPSARELERLQGCKCFPIKTSNSDLTTWADSGKEFAIVDRKEYEKAFAGRLVRLDFALEDIHAMENFLQAMGLDNRHLSRVVRHKTSATQGDLDTALTQKFQRRAYAICRYAAHLRSQQTRDSPSLTFEKLKQMEIFTSETIKKTLSVEFVSPVTVDAATGYCHIEEVDDKLKLYVSKQPRNRQIALAREVPLALLQHLGAQTESPGELATIISARSLIAVDTILEQAGIIELKGVAKPEQLEDDEEEEEIPRPANGATSGRSVSSGSTFAFGSMRNSLPRVSAPSVGSTPLSGGTSSFGSGFGAHSTNVCKKCGYSDLGFGTNSSNGFKWDDKTFVADYHKAAFEKFGKVSIPAPPDGPSNSPKPTPLFKFPTTSQTEAPPISPKPTFSFSTPAPQADTSYRHLLDIAINTAQSTKGAIPHPGDVLVRSPLTSHADVSSAVKGMDRPQKIGAAGELFVLEWLKTLALPGFDVSNWQSTIRKHAKEHPSYADLTCWYGDEIGDIVYDDVTGRLTKLLVNAGYLDQEKYRGDSRQKYFFEVKATPNGVGFPFYMSVIQHAKMVAVCKDDGNVYIVARVFNLGVYGMGLKLYVNPVELQSTRKLLFEGPTYTVKPGDWT